MSITINHPWARVQTAESRVAGGFMTFDNSGPEADRLIGAESPLAPKIDLHGIKVVGAALRMRPLPNGVGLPVGMKIELKPRGYHFQLHDLVAPLRVGQKVPLTLLFEKAGRRDVELVVEAEGYVGKDVLGLYEPPPEPEAKPEPK